MNVKYQIFVSSTYEDLKDERNEVIKACLNMGHIPMGMEMFNAADEEQWAVITRTIDECDYYVVIVAYRYGSTMGGQSFTEKEYDYAVAQGVPVLGFVIADKDVTWPPEWIDKDRKAVNSLQRFKTKMEKKIIRPWRNGSELRAVFVESFTTAINVVPRRGWVRAPAYADSDIAQTLSNLAEENAHLRRLLRESSQVSAEEIEDVRQILHRMTFPLNAQGQRKISLADIYQLHVAPNVLQESKIDINRIASKLTLDPESLNEMIGDLRFLNLVRVLNHGGYALTELGRRVMLRMFAT